MAKTLKKRIEEAEAKLQPHYDPGDDGSDVVLSLDELAALLAKRLRYKISKGTKYPLVDVLGQHEDGAMLGDGIKEMYDSARRGSYGSGLTTMAAKVINNHVQDYVPKVIELVRSLLPRRT